MTSQEKKAYLMRYLEAKCRFQDLSDEMIRIRSDAERITPMITDMPGGARVSDRIANAAERLTACADELEREAEHMQQLMREIRAVIGTVPDAIQRRLLLLRYIDGHTWEQIAVMMNYSYVHICRLHGKALSEIML